VEYDTARRGWSLQRGANQCAELPGLWFSVDELYALLMSYRLLSDLQPNVLDEYIEPIRQRVAALVAKEPLGHPDLEARRSW
jgi:predicted DNA-binding transcriptional regulator YafY